MTQDTNIQNLIINKLTKAQYEGIANPSDTELYLTPDTSLSADDLKTINNTSLIGNGNISVQAVISDLSTIRSGANAGATALQPNDNITQLTNNAGYITGITSSDVITALGYTPYNSTNPNGYITASALNGYATQTWVTNQNYVNNTTLTNTLANYALTSNLAEVATSGDYDDLINKPTIPGAVTENTVSGWGFTKNTGTVTSVNNVSPVNGNVTLAIPDTSNLANKDLSNLSTTGNSKFQAPLVSGTNIKTINNTSILGSGNITIASAPNIDNVTISQNTNDELQAIGVIDDNSGSAIKTWTGTKAQYDAIVTKDANTLYWVTDTKIIYLGETPVGNFSGGRNVGEIITSSLPLTDAGLHLLDGTRLSGDGIYSEFVDYIADLYAENPNANYFTDEISWQTSITQYGVCGKFVYDSTNNTVRLPKYSNKIYTQELDNTAPVIGNGRNLGLTDGNSNYSIATYKNNNIGRCLTATTNFVYPNNNPQINAGNQETINNISPVFGVSTNPDNSGLIAYLADIITSLDGYYYIVIANSTKTQIEVDIDKIVTDLNGKVDKADLTEVQCVIETYINGTSGYRVWSDGNCEQWGRISGGNQIVTLLKPYRDKNYSVFTQEGYKDNHNWNGNPITVGFNVLSQNDFTIATYGDYTNITAYWKTEGHL